MKKCLSCGKDVKNKYCNVSCQNKHQHLIKKSSIKYIIAGYTCKKCGNEFTQYIRKDGVGDITQFCSIGCARSYSTSECNNLQLKESRCVDCYDLILIKKRSFRIRCEKCKIEFKKRNAVIKQCKLCGVDFVKTIKKITFCSNRCSSIYNIAKARLSLSTYKRLKRSKNEIYFCELCEGYFKDVKHNEKIFNGWDADVIIGDIKYAILWNGKWHYEKITKDHSLIQVQNRDAIKVKEIVITGYTPYIIKDMGRYNKKFVCDEFQKFIQYLNDNILHKGSIRTQNAT